MAEISGNHPESELESEELFLAPPLTAKEGSPLARIAEAALRSEGLDGSPQGVTYATNGGDTSSRGIDTVVLGPGDIAQAHTRDEWIDLEELERSLVVQALERSGGNQTRAATLLGLNRDQIRYRIEKFGLVLTA